MNKRLLLLIVTLLIVGTAGVVGAWKLMQTPAVAPVAPAPKVASPLITPSAPPAIPVENYEVELKRIGQTYQNAVMALGATPAERLAKKQQWRSLVDTTIADLTRLTAPATSRQAHQDRYILFLTLKQELSSTNPSADRVQKLESSINQAWSK